MACIPILSWEVQDKLKLSSVLKEDVSNEADISKDEEDPVVPSHWVRLRPFQHPDLIDSRDSCELRLRCDPQRSLRIRRVRILATARNVEVYDRRGEYVRTVRGEKISDTDWHAFNCDLTDPCFEVKFKILSLCQPGGVDVGCVRSQLLPHQWPATRGSDDSGDPITRIVSNILLNQPSPAPATSQPDRLQEWLERRLESMEARLTERLNRLEARMESLASAIQPDSQSGLV